MEEDIFSSEIDSFIEDLYQSSHSNGKVQRKLSRMSLSVPTKGLLNAPGENNCYLNASVQLLWHMDVFRRSFRLLAGHACLENACIFCALKSIFQQFQDSQATVLAADQLRKAMANAFMDDQRFQLGRMDDAAECFENILHRLHNHIANSEFADTCSVKHCIPHQKFGQHILEQTSCQCKATSEPKAFYQFVHYVSASALVDLVQSNSSDSYEHTFGENLKMIMQCGERRPCPDEKRCLFKGKQPITTVQTTLMNCPDVVTVGVIWDSDHPSPKFISSFMDCIGETLYLVDLFDNIADDNHKRIGLNLCGVVAYYGKHYTSFFYNSKDKRWYYFDDENVQELGSDWINVKNKVHRSRFQPLLLTYTNAFGVAVDVKKAPSVVDIVSKEKLLYCPPSPVNQKPKGQRHKKSRRTHHDKLSKSSSDEACLSCKEESPRSSKKNTPSKSNSNNSANISNDVGPRFGHNTYSRDLNESFSNATHSKDKKSTDPSQIDIIINDKHSDSNDSNSNKTGDFLRKTFSHMKKNKPSGSGNNSGKNLKSVKEQEPDILREVSYADVGFDTYGSKQKSKTLPAVRSIAAETNESSKQLLNLERHQELLKLPKKAAGNKPELISELNARIHSTSSTGSSLSCDSLKPDSSQSDTSRSPEVVEILPEDDIYFQQGDFEAFVNQGEFYAGECDKFEKEGDFNSALPMCIRAKDAFLKACHIPGISEDVTQFADLKYMQYAQKEKIFLQRLNFASLKQKVDLVLSTPKEPNQSTSSDECERSIRSDNEVRQQPSQNQENLSSSKISGHLQLESSRNKNGIVTDGNDSSLRIESIYDRGRTSPIPNSAEKGYALFYTPGNKSTKTNDISNNKLQVEGSIKTVGQTSPKPTKQPVNTIERLRQSSQHNPKLYDPSAYNKPKKEKFYQERTIYDSPISSRKILETKEKKEIGSEDLPSMANTSTVAEKLIVENLRRFSADKDCRPSRCEHCGWKLVENNAKLCFSCQSYI